MSLHLEKAFAAVSRQQERSAGKRGRGVSMVELLVQELGVRLAGRGGWLSSAKVGNHDVRGSQGRADLPSAVARHVVRGSRA